MQETILAAEPGESRPGGQHYYVWEVAGKPVSVRLNLDVVERLDHDVVQTFRAITSRGSEVGGLLLGNVQGSGPYLVTIEDYEPVACDYRRGPLYLLADADKRRLAEALARWKASPPKPLSVVGYYRSNTRKELALDDDDLSVIEENFGERHNVILLVKPFAAKANVAGFFIWEEGKIRPEASPLTFPFSRAELAKTTGAALPAGAAAVKAPVTQAKREPAPETPAAQPQIEAKHPAPPSPPARPAEALRAAAPMPAVPSRPALSTEPSAAAKNEAPLAAPATPSPKTPPEMLSSQAPVAPSKPVASKPAAPTPARAAIPPRVDKPAPPLPGGEPKPAAPPPALKLEKPAAVEAASLAEPILAPPSFQVLAPPSAVSRLLAGAGRLVRSRAVQLGVLVAALIAAAVAVYVRGWINFAGDAPGADTSSLALKVERTGGQLLLSWNRHAQLLQTAQRAVLSISDGDHREDVEMDLAQLRSGSIVYAPITNDVSFRLQVTDLKRGKSLSESVRVLAGSAAPSGPAVPPPKPAAQPAATTSAPVSPGPGGAAPGGAPVAEPEGAQAAAGAPATPEQPKPMVPPPSRESLAARLSPAEIVGPAPELQQVQAPITVARPITTPIAPPPAPAPKPSAAETPNSPVTEAAKPAPSPPATPAAKTPSAPLRVGGAVRDAKLIRRRDPVYPPLARQARLQGVVRVVAVIGTDGRIEKAEALSGPPLLRQAAVDAVKQWVYQPALLNGQPVRVTTEIDVNFTLGGR